VRRLLVFVAPLALLAAACDCGVSRQSCTNTVDCPSGQVCSGGYCYAGHADGGATGGGGGGLVGGGGGSLGGGNGGGNQGGGNGGGNTGVACKNLQCQQTSCPANFSGCTVSACSGSATTTISGVVYDPSAQLPLYNAVVYVPNSTPDAFTDGATCESCGGSVTGSPLTITLTDAAGRFNLTNVPAGQNIPLVIQIGHWRRQVTIPNVTACTNTDLANRDLTRMPRTKAEGDIPQMAIATGQADPFECLLLKMGIASSEFTKPSANGRVHYYVNNGQSNAAGDSPGSGLYSSLATLKKYDVIFLPCEGSELKKTAAQTKNLVDYTTAGGRAFLTHYSYVWTAYGSAPFPSTANWAPDPNINNPPPDPVNVTVNQSFSKGQSFATWLSNVGAASNGIMSLTQSRNDVGTVVSATTAWMKGDSSGSTNGSTYNWTPHLTFNMPYNPPNLADGGPGQECGRVVFSNFHVTSDAASGFGDFPSACTGGAYTAQEKALVFMIYDLASCVQADNKPPTVCGSISETCAVDADCCNGLTCFAFDGNSCNGGTGCTCAAPIQ
jgi:hypothetical protein